MPTTPRRVTRSIAIAALAVNAAGCGSLPWLDGNGTAGSGNDVPPNGGGWAPAPLPVPGGGGGGAVDPGGLGKPSIEVPVPGQLNPTATRVGQMTPSVAGRRVRVLLAWWSGPPPCSVLDSVRVVRDGTTITMTPFEGADPKAGGQVACPAIAMLRGTIVDLGDLEPGTYTLVANGDIAPQSVTVD